jgi:ribosomal protein S27AE
MSEPKQACPRCGVDLGRLLYCTPLKDVKFFCPNCGLRVQMECPKCGNWMVMVERYCGKCGAKSIATSKLNGRYLRVGNVC